MNHFRLFVIRMLKVLLWGGVASMAWVVLSCEEFCEEPNRTAVVVNFFSSEDNKTLTVRKLVIEGMGNDSMLYSQTDHSQILLPVNPLADFVSFAIKNDTLPADTVIIRYSRHTGFISSQCGCAVFAEIQDEPERTENSITRVDVTSRKVTTVSYRQGVINAENIRIYY